MSLAQAVNLAFPTQIWILLVVALVLSAVGFYKYVYFLSIGYGFAIAGEGIAMLLLYSKELTFVVAVLCILFICYGVRLSSYLIYRECKNVKYKKTLKSATTLERPMSLGIKSAIWISVSLLYVMQVSPVYYRLFNEQTNGSSVAYIGITIMAVGLVVESLADMQKTRQKKENPNMVATKGLYALVRCPNYLGEILFWTGVIVSGCNILKGCCQWVMAVFSYICIVWIMFDGAKRLEIRQNKIYGSNSNYQDYVKKTPIILPFIPLYHLTKSTEKGNK